MNKIRKLKIESMMKRELSMLALTEIKDPRVKFVTIHSVSLTNDYKTAHVYVSVMGTESERKGAMNGLEKCRGFLRSQIGTALRLRYTPEIIFRYDDTGSERDRVIQLLSEIEKKEGNKGNEDEQE